MPITREQLYRIRSRIHNIVEDLGELGIQADEEFGEDSKASYVLCDSLAALEQAYEALV